MIPLDMRLDVSVFQFLHWEASPGHVGALLIHLPWTRIPIFLCCVLEAETSIGIFTGKTCIHSNARG